MKKRMFSLLMALCLVLGMLPTSALAAELPETASFNGVRADVEGDPQVSEAGVLRVSLDGTDLGETLHHHILVPEGSTTAYVTYSADAVHTADGRAYGLACSLPGGSGEAATLPAETGADGSITIAVPVADYLAFEKEDGSWEGEAFAPQDGSFLPVGVLSFGFDLEAAAYDAVTIPDGAPFTAITSDKGDVKGIEDMGTVGFDAGWMGSVEADWYHITLPTGAKSAKITFANALNHYDDMYSGEHVVAGFYVDTETEPWAGNTTGYGYVDDYTVNILMSMSVTDMMSEEALELSFIDAYAAAPQDADSNPIALFTFAREANDCSHENVSEATCTEASVCLNPDCGATVGKALGHDWGEWTETKAPSCTEAGSRERVCKRDENHTESESIPALKHDWGEWVQTLAPTCTDAGSKTRTCTRDSSHTETNTTDADVKATGHSFNGTDCDNPGCDEPDPDANAPALEDGVYPIGDAEDLLWFADKVSRDGMDISVVLTTDIDLSNVTWTPIGTSSKPFAGSFDGKGHSVTFADASNGLFAYVKGSSAKHAVIKDVVIEGSISGGSSVAVAGVAAKAAYADISGCINKAAVDGGQKVAGIVGERLAVGIESCRLQISNCRNEGKITASSTNAAGIIGYTNKDTSIIGCSNIGEISGSANKNSAGVGGLVGYIQNGGPIQNSYNLGKINGSDGGGLIGNLYNGVSVTNCYNAGTAAYGIAGYIYNKTSPVTNCYYLASASTQAFPAQYTNAQLGTVAIDVPAKTRNELGADSFAATLGDAFAAACPFPALSWEQKSGHEMENGVCKTCDYGSGEKATFAVTLNQGTGYTISGETSATEGESYTFTVTIHDGYRKAENFAVKVNNVEAEPSSDTEDGYTWPEVKGNLNITVSGVEKIPDFHTITLPQREGYGYRITPQNGVDNGGTVTVNRNTDFRFSVTFVDGFEADDDFAVTANGVKLSPDNGVYTVPAVQADQTIAITGVKQIPRPEHDIDITMTISYGQDVFHTVNSDGTALMLEPITIPYFDLALYDLDAFYYNPLCYEDENGEPQAIRPGGTPESAYGKVTTIHAFVYLTEIYRMGIPENLAGTGYSMERTTADDFTRGAAFRKEVSWSGGPGSTFMNLWDHGENLNYYPDYCYPLGTPGIGATCDQILLQDGDSLRVHLISDPDVTGSNFPFFLANKEDGDVNIQEDHVDSFTVKQGEPLDLTLYRTVNDGTYNTKYETMGNADLYWVDEDNLGNDVSKWYRDDFAGLPAEEFVSGGDGKLSIDTAMLEPGTYYIGARGYLTEGGYGDGTGFISEGDETGAAIFRLTVEEGDAAPAVMYGDVNEDGGVTAYDASLVLQYVASNITADELSAEIADVDGNGSITAYDASLVLQFVASNIDKFPVEE